MKEFTIIAIITGVVTMLIIFVMCILMFNQMEQRIDAACEKVNYTGIVSFWDADIDCVQFYNRINLVYTVDNPNYIKDGIK